MADIKQVHREKLETLASKNWDRMRELLHEDYQYMDASGEQLDLEGSVSSCQYYTTALPDLSVEVRHQHTAGDDVSVIEFTVRGTHKAEFAGVEATGREVQILVCNVAEGKDGKILREREYFDVMSLMQQLGAMGDDT